MYQNCAYITDCNKDDIVSKIFSSCPKNNKVVAFMNGTEVIQHTNFINVHNSTDTAAQQQQDNYIYEINSKTLFRKGSCGRSLSNDEMNNVYVLVEHEEEEEEGEGDDNDYHLITPNMVIGIGNQFFTKPIYWTRIKPPSKPLMNPYEVRPELDAILFDPYLRIYRPLTLDLQSIYWRFYFLPIYEKRYYLKRINDSTIIRYRHPKQQQHRLR